MLSDEVRSQDPFNALPPLEGRIEHRISHMQAVGEPFQPPWVRPLSEHLLRIRRNEPGEDANGAQAISDDWKTHAERLRSTQFQKVRRVDIVPYVDGQPAGQIQERLVGWVDFTLFLSQEGAAVYDELGRALSEPFPDSEIRQAIKACIERSPGWIADYFESHFDLESSLPAPREPKWPEPTGNGPMGDGEMPGDFGAPGAFEPELPTHEEETDTPGDPTNGGGSGGGSRRTPGDRKQKIHRFWRRQGFGYSKELGIWRSPRGIVRRSPPGGLFQWILTKADGTEHRYWIGDRPLSDGVQIPSDTWHFIQERPESTSVLLPNDQGELEEVPGIQLNYLVKQGQIQIFPATYRLRQVQPTER